MKIEKIAIPILIVGILILLFPMIKKEWDKYNAGSEDYAYVPETVNAEEYDKKGLYYPGYTDYEKNEYSSKYLGIRFKCPKNFVMDGKTITVQKIEDFNKYKDPSLYSDDIVFDELNELIVTGDGGDASMYLFVGRGSIPLNNETKQLLANHLKDAMQKDAGKSAEYTVKKIHKEKLCGKTFNVIDIDGKYPDLKVTSHLHYYIRNVKKNYVAIVFEGTNKKDIKKMQKAFKKYK